MNSCCTTQVRVRQPTQQQAVPQQQVSSVPPDAVAAPSLATSTTPLARLPSTTTASPQSHHQGSPATAPVCDQPLQIAAVSTCIVDAASASPLTPHASAIETPRRSPIVPSVQIRQDVGGEGSCLTKPSDDVDALQQPAHHPTLQQKAAMRLFPAETWGTPYSVSISRHLQQQQLQKTTQVTAAAAHGGGVYVRDPQLNAIGSGRQTAHRTIVSQSPPIVGTPLRGDGLWQAGGTSRGPRAHVREGAIPIRQLGANTAASIGAHSTPQVEGGALRRPDNAVPSPLQTPPLLINGSTSSPLPSERQGGLNVSHGGSSMFVAAVPHPPAATLDSSPSAVGALTDMAQLAARIAQQRLQLPQQQHQQRQQLAHGLHVAPTPAAVSPSIDHISSISAAPPLQERDYQAGGCFYAEVNAPQRTAAASSSSSSSATPHPSADASLDSLLFRQYQRGTLDAIHDTSTAEGELYDVGALPNHTPPAPLPRGAEHPMTLHQSRVTLLDYSSESRSPSQLTYVAPPIRR